MRNPVGSRDFDFSISAYVRAKGVIDTSLFELADELSAAVHELSAASARLSQAERRLARQPAADAKEPLPAWFEAAEAAESAASALIGRLCIQIANIPARTKAGLAVKLRLVAGVFSEDDSAAGRRAGRSDVGERLIESIMLDVGASVFETSKTVTAISRVTESMDDRTGH
jgi:hypothetical protein